VLERPHVVEAVRELHEQHADVARHRDQHLAEALRLLVLLAGEVDLAELGDPVDEERDLLAEDPLEVLCVTLQSSTTSWSSAAQTLAGSSLSSVMIDATDTGCVMYGSPLLRFWPSCFCAAKT
jgi:hypothetical protein